MKINCPTNGRKASRAKSRRICITSSALGDEAKGTYLALDGLYWEAWARELLVEQKDDVVGILTIPHSKPKENRFRARFSYSSTLFDRS